MPAFKILPGIVTIVSIATIAGCGSAQQSATTDDGKLIFAQLVSGKLLRGTFSNDPKTYPPELRRSLAFDSDREVRILGPLDSFGIRATYERSGDVISIAPSDNGPVFSLTVTMSGCLEGPATLLCPKGVAFESGDGSADARSIVERAIDDAQANEATQQKALDDRLVREVLEARARQQSTE